MSREFEEYRQGIRRQVELERKESLRRPIVSARRAEAGIDFSQMKIKQKFRLRITSETSGAEPEDIGKFWFIPGYSLVGGPDIVPEE